MTYGRSNTDILFSIDRLLWTVLLTVQNKNNLMGQNTLSFTLQVVSYPAGGRDRIEEMSFTTFHLRNFTLLPKTGYENVR